MPRRRRIAMFASWVLVGLAAVVACTGDDPQLVQPIIAGNEAGASSSSGATSSSSSGNSSSGTTLTDACAEEPDARPFCQRVSDAADFCTSFEEELDAGDAGYTVERNDVGMFYRFEGGRSGRFALHADSHNGADGQARGGNILFKQAITGQLAKKVVVHARIRPEFDPTAALDSDAGLEGAVDLIRVFFNPGGGSAALRYSKRTLTLSSVGEEREVRGYFVETTAPGVAKTRALEWRPMPQPLVPGQWREVHLTVEPAKDSDTPNAKVGLVVAPLCDFIGQERYSSSVFVPGGGGVAVWVGNYSNTAVTTPNAHAIDDVWVEIER